MYDSFRGIQVKWSHDSILAAPSQNLKSLKELFRMRLWQYNPWYFPSDLKFSSRIWIWELEQGLIMKDEVTFKLPVGNESSLEGVYELRKFEENTNHRSLVHALEIIWLHFKWDPLVGDEKWDLLNAFSQKQSQELPYSWLLGFGSAFHPSSSP